MVFVKGTDFKTISNKDGSFSIIIPDDYKTLIFVLKEYKSEEIEISSNKVNIILSLKEIDILNLSIEELLQLKINTAGKKEERIADIPASVVLITCERIEKQGYKTLEEISTNVPGMYMIDDYGWKGTKNYGVRVFFQQEHLMT